MDGRVRQLRQASRGINLSSVVDCPLSLRQNRGHVDPQDLERIARKVLRELGAGDVDLVVKPGAERDRWQLIIGGRAPATMTIRCGPGTTPEFVRTQIFEQFQQH